MAPTWVDSITGDTDGLTTNGVAILRPIGAFESGVEPGEWMEVTVMGNVRKMRPERSSRIPNSPVSSYKRSIHYIYRKKKPFTMN